MADKKVKAEKISQKPNAEIKSAYGCTFWADGGYCDYSGNCRHQSGYYSGSALCGNWKAEAPDVIGE